MQPLLSTIDWFVLFLLGLMGLINLADHIYFWGPCHLMIYKQPKLL